MLTNDYSAELGRTSGAVVDIITKAGTNEFHGSAYEYLRNDMFDARDFFAKAGVSAKPEYRQNVFGGSVGGPIIKNKTFFFWNVEGNRTIQGQTQSVNVPTAFEEANPGNFSDIFICGQPPSAATCAPGPIVPAGSINSVALNYFKLYPAPNIFRPENPDFPQGTDYFYTSVFNKTQYSTSTDGRIDHRFSDKDSIFIRFGYDPVSTFLPGALPAVQMFGKTVQPGGTLGGGPSKTVATNVQGSYIHIFNPNLVMELKAGYTRIDIHTRPLDFNTGLGNDFGVVNGDLPGVPGANGLPTMWMLFGDYASLGDGIFIPIFDTNNTFQYNGAVTYTRGSHNIKAGGALIRRQLNYLQDQWAASGGFVFDPFAGPTFNTMANFLSGAAAFSVRGDDLAEQGLRSWEPSLYVQDDWHAKSWLTLNLGLRWETYTPLYDAHNKFANFDLNTLTIRIAGVDTSKTGGVRTDYTDFSPRLGFAAQLGHNTVLRGGFGYSYYPPIMQTQIQNPNPPFDYICFPCGGTTFPAVPIPSASATNPAGGVSSIIPGMKNAYVRQYNLFVEKALGWGNTFNVGFVGEQGRRALYLRNADLPLPPGPGEPTPAFVYATQLPLVNDIQYIDNSGFSNYYGLQSSFTHRTGNGLLLSANYTYGHGLTNSIQRASTVTGSFALVTNNPRYDYGNSALDVRHRIAGYLSYELPFGKSLQGFAAQAARGWQVNLIGFWQTGLPFTVTDGAARINLPGITSDRPNMIGSPYLADPSLLHYFNTAAFEPQTDGTAGDEPNNAVYGPHARVLNASILKDFPIKDALRLQFRAECFNLTNTPNFAQPASDISQGNAGVISATAANMNPREFQFALKLMF